MPRSSVKQIKIKRIREGSWSEPVDVLAAEEPLEIRLTFNENGRPVEKSLSVTMRTPGNDFELALGFLYTEGIISDREDISSIRYCETVKTEEERGNVVKVVLTDHLELDFKKLERHFYTSSSCGVCGKSSLESVSQQCPVLPRSGVKINSEVLFGLQKKISEEQTLFKHTGGIHASVLFNSEGELVLLREDVGRHNALDKMIGVLCQEGKIPAADQILLVSGRASFELVQKALMAGISVMCAVGAPSSLAADLATEHNMTLIGFLKEDGFNIYSGSERILD